VNTLGSFPVPSFGEKNHEKEFNTFLLKVADDNILFPLSDLR